MMIALLAVSSGYVAPLHRSGRLAHCGAARCGAARASVVPTYDLDAPIFLDEAALLSAKGELRPCVVVVISGEQLSLRPVVSSGSSGRCSSTRRRCSRPKVLALPPVLTLALLAPLAQ